MKISLNWLQEIMQKKLTIDQVSKTLTSIGFPVDAITQHGLSTDLIISAKIELIEKHPNADRLQVATLNDGKEKRIVVCGAPNIQVGQIVPLAIPGAVLPGNFTISISKIRGVESSGMLCSDRELGLSNDHAGIKILPTETPLGKPLKSLLGGSDSILEVDITPNRPDLMSHVGLARELAVSMGISLNLKLSKIPSSPKIKSIPIKIEEPKRCSRYIGRVFQNIQIKKSPDWMIQRLERCGIRSINNIVDITNYVLLEYGHPLHAFDLAELKGSEIRIRLAGTQEKILALDEKEYPLKENDLVIADKENPVAIAGVMGGQLSAVSESTKSLLLESAVFERIGIRKTSRRMALISESSLRFEKGTDAETCELAANRAAQLILELAGGEAGAVIDEKKSIPAKNKIFVTQSDIESILGIKCGKPQINAIFKNLGFQPKSAKAGWTCTTPAHRKDISESIDLVEEVVRFIGYETIPSFVRPSVGSRVPDKFLTGDEINISECLRSLGFDETLSSSFCSIDLLKRFSNNEQEFIAVSNPLSQEDTHLRPHLIFNLLKAVQSNIHHQRKDIHLFEMGNRFIRHSHTRKLDEITSVGFVAARMKNTVSVYQHNEEVDFYDLKGWMNQLLSVAVPDVSLSYSDEISYLHPQQQFSVMVNKKKIGFGGLLHPAVTEKFNGKFPVVVGELDLLSTGKTNNKFESYSKFPFVDRDLAILINKDVLWSEIEAHAKIAGGELLKNIWPFDVFQGGNMDPQLKSLAFRCRLQAEDRTLSEKDINDLMKNILDTLTANCGARLR